MKPGRVAWQPENGALLELAGLDLCKQPFLAIGSPPDSPEAACLSRMADRRSALPCFGDWPWRAARRRTSRPDQQPPRSPTRKAHGAPPASGRAAQAGDSDSGLRRPLARARRKKNKADITAGGKRKAHGTGQREAKSALHCEKQLPLKRDLTFDMSGGAKGAQRPLGRPLDGGVRRHVSPLPREVPAKPLRRWPPATQVTRR